MIIGFGKTETDFENALEEKLFEIVEKEYDCEHDMFSDGFIERMKKAVNGWAKESQDKADEYKTAENYPSRYTQFWAYTLGDCNYCVFVITFHHINRRHGLSPDGWALMRTEKAFAVSVQDIRKKARKAA